MRTSLIALLMLLPCVDAGDVLVGRFRLKRTPNIRERGFITEADSEGFRFERIGLRGRRTRVRWVDVVSGDAQELKVKLGLAKIEKPRIVKGHRITFKGGLTAEGVLVRIDPALSLHLVKEKGVVFRYPSDRVLRVEKIDLRPEAVYSKDELYEQELDRRPPRTAGDHLHLAERLRDHGNYLKALEHYRKALALDPQRPSVQNDVRQLERYEKDKELLELLRKANYLFNLRHQHKEAMGLVAGYATDNPERARAAQKELDRMRERYDARRQREFNIRKHKAVHAVIDKYTRQGKTLAEAKAWVRNRLAKQLQEALMKQMGIDRDAYKVFLERSRERNRGTPFFAGYGAGSFIIMRRAQRGKSTKQRRAGDPEKWWLQGDVSIRSAWLRAYAADKLENVFEIVSVRHEPCPRCGGQGKNRVQSVRPVQNKHTWMETCPRCFGGRYERRLSYR